MDGMERLLGIGLSLALGAVSKHKTKLPHKMTGLPQNGAMGGLSALAFGGGLEDAALVTAGTEVALNVGKFGWNLFRRIFG